MEQTGVVLEVAAVEAIAVIAAPQLISACDVLSIDGSGSSGSGALSYRWEISGAHGNLTSDITAPSISLPVTNFPGRRLPVTLTVFDSAGEHPAWFQHTTTDSIRQPWAMHAQKHLMHPSPLQASGLSLTPPWRSQPSPYPLFLSLEAITSTKLPPPEPQASRPKCRCPLVWLEGPQGCSSPGNSL